MGLLNARTMRRRPAGLLLTLLICTSLLSAEVVSDNQVEALFLFNFAHFVAWPAAGGSEMSGPFTIGVLGNEQIGARLDETVRGESVDGRPLTVLHFHRIEDMVNCQVLFIDSSETPQLRRIVSTLNNRSTLTVSDIPGAAEQGVMIQFVEENNRIRLRVNVEAARAAGLTLSSKLLRAAELVGATKEN
jgi:hypothetical protein